MSTIKCEVCEILSIERHNNADSLEIAVVQGWQICVRKDIYKAGDRVVYFEPGTTLTRIKAEELGVAQYLSERTNINGDRVLVINQIKLRGEPSFGLVLPADSEMVLGSNVADFYGAAKYEPPLKGSAGDEEKDHPLFPRYTSLENMRSYPNILENGEEVVITEKIHGSNCRVGYVYEDDNLIALAGSRQLRRTQPSYDEMASNIYWYPHTLESVQNLMCALQDAGDVSAVLYGEIYGKKIQIYNYGEQKIGFRAFDLTIDGAFVDYQIFEDLCDRYNVDRVPLLYRGAFSLDTVKALSNGESLVGGSLGREGVVVKPVRERTWRNGRLILKYVGDDYLLGKAHKQDTTDF